MIAGAGATIAIGVMEWMSVEFQYPLAVIPFATSIALVVGSPQLPAAQPRALIGGHLISTLVGPSFLQRTDLGLDASPGQRELRPGLLAMAGAGASF